VAANAQPGRLGSTFDNQGGGGLNIQGGPKAVEVEIENKEVRDALRRITEEDFGFSESLWLNWYVDNHTIANIDLRRDE
jgi:hypothetical protein